MNFQTILEELDRLYEEDCKKTCNEEVPEEVPEEALTEAAEEVVDDEEIEIVEDEPAEDEVPVDDDIAEEVRLVLECANCGAVSIMAETAAKADEESGLVNLEESCQYCEATDGYKVLGVLTPYGSEATVEIEAEVEADVEDADEPVEVED